VVIVDDPGAGEYYGGVVAAPVFSRIVDGALRILAVAPDDFSPRRRSDVTLAANP
jgi:cell division protein FtsI (penicillin-binding protein 3)